MNMFNQWIELLLRLSKKYVERKLYRPTHLALLPMTTRGALETEKTKSTEKNIEIRRNVFGHATFLFSSKVAGAFMVIKSSLESDTF